MDSYELYDVVKEKRMGWVGTIVEILPDDSYMVEWEDDWLFAYGENLEPWWASEDAPQASAQDLIDKLREEDD